MIAHVVLFTPRADLTAADRARFLEALTRALESVPSVRRYRIGRRVRTGAAYDSMMAVDYEFFGVVEFDDRAGLLEYLGHETHEELGRLFYEMSAHALAYDYDVVDRAPGALLAGP